jgi:hypothetical protein
MRLFESREGRSETMERTEVTEEVIDLGTIVEHTHGSAVNFADTDGGQRILPGLSDD